jgi:hypothetical protein
MSYLRVIMRARLLTIVGLILAIPARGSTDDEKDQILFPWAGESAAKDWVPIRLPEVEQDQPAPKAEILPAGNGLKITFDGGEWPAIGTTKVGIPGNWKSFQTLKADLTVDRPSIAYFRVTQGKPDEKANLPHWEKTMNLLPGRNDVTLLIRAGIGSMDPAKGEVSSFIIGMFRPGKGQTLNVGAVRLSPDWPAPRLLGWYSPYNHDGYSAGVAREFQRTGAVTRFKVLGTDLEVSDLPDLAKRLKDRWSKPAPRTIEEVEVDFKADFEKLKGEHPKAAMALLREGEKGGDPSNPEAVYEGWTYAYLNCHGPDGPNRGREHTPGPSDTVEVFMRHRSPLLRVDFAAIPKGARILAARFVITRAGAADLKVPEKPNLWTAEPCNREWDATSVNCYSYAPGEHWKGVSGLYYGDDPDFWPVFLMHGPAGGGAVTVWDFTEAVRFWLDGNRANHGFFLYGDSNDYMRMYTPKAKNLKQRPAVMIIYEPN